MRDLGEKGRKARSVGDVRAEPEDALGGFRDPGPDLGHVGIALVKDRYGPLPGAIELFVLGHVVLVAIVGAHKAVRVAIGPGSYPLGQVELGALVMVAVKGEHVPDVERAPGSHRKRIVLGVAVLDPGAQAEIGVDPVKHAPHAAQGVVGVIVLAGADRPEPVQRSVLRIPPAQFLESGEKELGVHKVRAIWLDLADAELVGGHKDLAVRDPLGHPGRVVPVIGQGTHLEHPGLVLIRHQQGLAGRVVAVLLDELAHERDGIAGGLAALEGDAGKLGAVENPYLLSGVHRLFSGDRLRLVVGSVGALAHHQVVLIHHAIVAIEIGVRMGYLGDVSDRLGFLVAFTGEVTWAALLGHDARIAIVLLKHLPHGSGLVVLGRDVNEPLVRQFVVVRVCHHHRTVCAGALGDNHRRAHDNLLMFGRVAQ